MGVWGSFRPNDPRSKRRRHGITAKAHLRGQGEPPTRALLSLYNQRKRLSQSKATSQQATAQGIAPKQLQLVLERRKISHHLALRRNRPKPPFLPFGPTWAILREGRFGGFVMHAFTEPTAHPCNDLTPLLLALRLILPPFLHLTGF